MTNQQILEKAIRKAINGGWRPINAWVTPKTTYQWKSLDDGGYVILCKKYIHEKESDWFESAEQLIFNHDFAKALWGYDTVTVAGEKRLKKPLSWQYHLQQMVIADDPIAYLGENLPE